ncbi:MAG: transposase [Terriglobales bacterium]
MPAWGQPPSAVPASAARHSILSQIRTLPGISFLLSSLTATLPPALSCGASLRGTAEGGCPHANAKSFLSPTTPTPPTRRQTPFLDLLHLQPLDSAGEHPLHCSGLLHSRSRTKIELLVAVVMPDHVHLIFTPLVREMATCSLAEITNAIKGAAAHKINQALQRKGRIWQSESFDHVIRSSESLGQKIQYLLDNPVRRGLVRHWMDYPWTWHDPQWTSRLRSFAPLDSRGRLSPRKCV